MIHYASSAGGGAMGLPATVRTPANAMPPASLTPQSAKV